MAQSELSDSIYRPFRSRKAEVSK